MMRSMYAGVSGLRNHQTRMDVIGNNIANVNTAGFKKSRVVFKDMLYQNIRGASSPTSSRGGTNPMGVGLGMTLSSIDQIHTGAPTSSTGRLTDMAIDGNGYFVVNEGSNRYYTRAGAFDFDTEGNLITADGLRVQGWLTDPNTWVLDTNGDPTNISIAGYKTIEARATKEMIFSGNLDSGLKFVSGRNEVQTLTFPDIANGGNPGGVFSLTLDDQTTGFIQVGANGTDTAARIQAALEALPNVGTGNVLVKWDQTRGRYDITFQNTMGNTNILSTITYVTPPAVVETTKGIPNDTSEVQTLSMGGVTSGTFALTYDGVPTNPINFGNDAADTATNIRDALATIPALSTVGAVTVIPDGDDFRITFANTMGDVNLISFTPVTGGPATVDTTTEGQAPLSVLPVNEVQELNLTTSTGGAYTLTYGGVTTTPIAFDANAETIQAAIEAIPALNGNISVKEVMPPVSGTVGGDFTITFDGSLAGSNVEEMQIDNLPGCDANIGTPTPGQSPVNETQVLNLTTAAGGAYTLTYGGVPTALISFDADAATIQAALEAIPALTGNINVAASTPPVPGTSGGSFTIEFTNALADSNVNQMGIDYAPKCTGSIGTPIPGETAVNEIQAVNLTTAAGGAFTLTYNGVRTARINFDADAATIQAALEAIPGLSGNIKVTASTPPVPGTSGGSFTIEFINALAGSNVNEMDLDFAPACTGNIDSSAEGQPATNEIQALDITTATVGNFKLSHGGVPTGLINFDADAATIQAALETIPDLTGNINVTEITSPIAGLSGGSFTIEFINDLAGRDVSELDATYENGCTGTNSTNTPGQPVVNETQVLNLTAAAGGAYTLTYGGVPTALISFDADAATIQAALEAIPALTGNINVAASTPPVPGISGGSFTIEFINTLAGSNVDLMGINYAPACIGSIGTPTSGQPAVNETQAVNLTAATGGAFTLAYNNVPTGLINFDADAATIQAALEAIPGLSGNIKVTASTPPVPGTSGGSFTIEFINALAGSNVNEMDLDFAPACTGTIGTSAQGQPAINEIQALDITAATVGNFTLSHGGESTALIPFDADAATIQAALETIPALTGNINVTEITSPIAGLSGGNFTIEFINGLAGSNVSQLVLNTMGSTGTIATTTQGQAPGYPENTVSGSKDVYDSQGNKVTVYYRFFKYEVEPGTYPGETPVDQPETRWACDFSTDPLFEKQEDYDSKADFGAVDLAVPGTINGKGDKVFRVFNIPFNEMGNIEDSKPTNFQYNINRQVPPPGHGSANINCTIDFAELTQRAGDSSAWASYQNGYAQGSLTSYSVGSDGTITGVYDNEERRDLARVAIANFENPSGLQQMGGTLFAVSGNSGDADIGAPMTGGRGKIIPSSLEMSNVDLSEEFTDMIVTQRGFQANSRIITTSDEMLQELVNLKR